MSPISKIAIFFGMELTADMAVTEGVVSAKFGGLPMPDEVSYDKDADIFQVRSHGEVTKKDVLDCLDTIKRMAGQSDCIRVLIDTTEQASSPSLPGFLELVKNLPYNLRGAILTTKDNATYSNQTFLETASMNRGRQVRLFSDSDAALKWLKS